MNNNKNNNVKDNAGISFGDLFGKMEGIVPPVDFSKMSFPLKTFEELFSLKEKNKDIKVSYEVTEDQTFVSKILIALTIPGFEKDEVSVKYIKPKKTLIVIAAKKEELKNEWPFLDIPDYRKNIGIHSIENVEAVLCELKNGILAIQVIAEKEKELVSFQ